MPEKGIKLDVRDRRLLVELNFNARQANAELAKKLRLSKKGVDYKIKRLEREGVIEGYYPVVNFLALGYLYCRVLLKLQCLTAEKKAEMARFVHSHPKMRWAIWARGGYDLVIGVWVKGVKEFRAVVQEFAAAFEPNVKEKTTSMVSRLSHFRYKFLTGKTDFEEFSISETADVSVDDADLAVLKQLALGGRMSLVEIGLATGLHPKKVAYRLKELKEKGVLLTTRALINHQLLGYTHYKVFLFLTAAVEEEVRVLKAYLAREPALIYIVEDVGIWDLDIEVMFRSNAEFFSFLDRLQSQFPELIRHCEFMVYTDTLKVSYLPF